MKKGETQKQAHKRIEFQKAKILAVLENGWSFTAACRRAGISKTQAIKWRSEDRVFDENCDAAVESGTDVLEDVATSRAKRQKSDILTMFLLKGRRPEKFRDNQTPDRNNPVINVNIKRF